MQTTLHDPSFPIHKDSTTTNYNFSLICLLIFKALLIAAAIVLAGIGLGPDEAQYWLWSKNLAWGYYSKPPGIAWAIALSSSLFGDTEFGVRSVALVLGFLLPLATCQLARSCGMRKNTIYWTGVAMATTPLGILASFLSTTDAGMTLFFTLACSVLARCLRKKKTPKYLLLGTYIALGALFKWPVYVLWIPTLYFVYRYQHFRSKKLVLGIAISLTALLPTLFWNISNDFATFKHVGTAVIKSGDAQKALGGNFFDFLGAQAALISPIFFILLIASYIYFFKKRASIPTSLQFCAYLSLTVIGIYLSMSVFKKMQGNWCAFIYPCAIVFTCWISAEKWRSGKAWMLASALLSMSITIFAFIGLPYRMTPFKHNLGWHKMELALHEVGYDPSESFLFSDRYQTSSLLSFYSPGQKRAYFLNLGGTRQNQFSFWPSMKDDQLNQNGYYVWIENRHLNPAAIAKRTDDLKKQLSPYFSDVLSLGFYPLVTDQGTPLKGCLIFKCMHYNGQEPSQVVSW